MGLDFLLLILSEPWLTSWAFLIFEGPLVLDFNTRNILDLNKVLNYIYIDKICFFIHLFFNKI